MSNNLFDDLAQAKETGCKFMVIKKDGTIRYYRFDPKKGLLLLHQAYQTPSKLTINELLHCRITLVSSQPKTIILQEEPA